MQGALGEQCPKASNIWSADALELVWAPSLPWDQTTHTNSQCRGRRHLLRNVVWASVPQELRRNQGQSPSLVSQGFNRWGVTFRICRRGRPAWFTPGVWPPILVCRSRSRGIHPPWFPRIQHRGLHGDGPNSRQILQQTGERGQGGDQAPMASIARVRASKSETWSLTLCLRTYSMNGVLICGTKEEAGSQVW